METAIAQNKYLRIHPHDNVIVALANLSKGATIENNGDVITLQQNVPAKHKFFIHDMQTGDEIYMYGVLVGKAQNEIPRGGLMTTSNTKHASGQYAYRHTDYTWNKPDVSKFINRTFNGYVRSDGRVGTANYWLFMPTVFCENRNLDVIREALHNELGYAVTDKYKNFTRMLFEAHKAGEDIDRVGLH